MSRRSSLLGLNKLALKKIFLTHLKPEDQRISPDEFVLVCQKLKISPDVLIRKDLGALLKECDLARGVSYRSFENLLSLIAERYYEGPHKMKKLLTKIKDRVDNEYGEQIKFRSKTGETADGGRSSNRAPTPKNRSSPKTHLSPTRALKKHSKTPSHKTIEHHSIFDTKKVPKIDTQFVKVIGHKTSRMQSATKRSENKTPRRNSTCFSEGITNIFHNFKQKHYGIINKSPRLGKPDYKVFKQERYIQKLRKSLFDSQFVLSIIFKAWKLYIAQKIATRLHQY